MSFSDFVLERLHRPSRILEIGAGAGELTRSLARAGHDCLGIDPLAEAESGVLTLSFEAFSPPARTFDAVVLQRVLHHLNDLDGSLTRIADLLRSDGKLFIEDFATERMDETTANWFWDRWKTIGVTRKGAPPADARAFLTQWREAKRDNHTALAMHDALLRYFDEGTFAWGAHIAYELGDPETEPLEVQAISRGQIAALGFRYAGALEAL
jgi:2-polyprenyl-3-methyl-5-hydroxy-6-metoxy-1,4-benzoquinol methylase